MAHFRDRCDLIDVDGARLVFPDGWGLVGPPTPSPALVLRFEAETPERLSEIRRMVEEPLAAWIAEMTP